MSQNFEAIIGPGARYSEHKVGETIRFRQNGLTLTGEIIHVRAPGQAVVDGKQHGLLYFVDVDDGFPLAVSPGEVIEEAPHE